MSDIVRKIRQQKRKLEDVLNCSVKDGERVNRDEVINQSQKLDELINDYNKAVMKKKSGKKAR